ncbi:MAG: hypothetical protein M1821_005846 [Bathelium mastoideum]|nr:MAG: hypothetical protein M1821_005846 [Bathelium mastoideum]
MAFSVVGQWGSLFELKTVAVHASLLPNGKVLYWGRRSNPHDTTRDSLNEHFTKPYLWNPFTGASKATASQPKLFGSGAKDVNLFCSGHSLQPDGSLLIVGGHLEDGKGVNQSCVYNPLADTWSAKSPMNEGRWYPSALTLPDGSVLSIAGTFGFIDAKGESSNPTNIVPQVWRTNTWQPLASPPGDTLLPYPRLHLDPNGRVFMAGPQKRSQFLDVNASGGLGTWTTDGPKRQAGAREYGPSVMYDSGKVIYIGGGNNADSDGTPTKMTESIDLRAKELKWTREADMLFARRQHNATVLPDGSILVTGGTQGAGFNNLDAGKPVHAPELWNPVTKQWSLMADESADRCYHAIALLLPDGRVLSAGGGEYSPNNDGWPNLIKDSLANAQLFSPPYLFKGKGVRPTISSVPSEINYNQLFEVTVDASDSIDKSFMRLDFKQRSRKVIVNAPANANLSPPGHYMLFLLNKEGVPSVAPIVRIGPFSTPAPLNPAVGSAHHATMEKHASASLPALNEKIITEQARPAVVVGLTSICPYGLGPCWGGAHDALQHISDIDVVRPVPDQANSLAFVYLKQDLLPDIDVWRSEFAKTANGAYVMRGFEITLSGVVNKQHVSAEGQLMLAGTLTRPELPLAPFQASSKIEWDITAQAPKPVSDAEAGAYARLFATLADRGPPVTVQVTGRLQKYGANKFSLDVREFEVVNDVAATSKL